MNIMHKTDFYCELRNFGRSVAINAAFDDKDGSPVVAMPATFQKISEADLDGVVARPPLLEVGMRGAQKLMDELWRCGLRPSEGTGSAGALAATERHLKDMQDISRKLMDRVMQDMISPAPPPFGDVIR